jgi:hypothetical protein
MVALSLGRTPILPLDYGLQNVRARLVIAGGRDCCTETSTVRGKPFFPFRAIRVQVACKPNLNISSTARHQLQLSHNYGSGPGRNLPCVQGQRVCHFLSLKQRRS